MVITAPSILLIIAPTKPNTIETKIRTSQLNTTNHQYSERGARPCIDAYLSKQIFTESNNVIIYRKAPV